MKINSENIVPDSVRRNTIQRNMVLTAVNALANHPSADDVYKYVKKQYPDISKATVYRNLNVLAQEGTLRRICVANAADRFDHNIHRHYHLRCLKCGSFSDIDIPYMTEVDKKAALATDYVLSSHDIIFEGLCRTCKNVCN